MILHARYYDLLYPLRRRIDLLNDHELDPDLPMPLDLCNVYNCVPVLMWTALSCKYP